MASADEAAPCIELEALSLRFGALKVLEGLSLTVREREFVSLLGPSGCGKSTLLRAMAGLVAPSGGAVRVCGRDPREGTQGLQLSFMFQKPLLLPWRTTLENVLLPLEIALGGNRASPLDEAKAQRILRRVRLEGFESAYPRELSGGMQQRVALARALVSDPEILLLDEPFGALDELTRDALNEELVRLWLDPQAPLKAVVMVTHSLHEALAMSDRVFVLGARPAGLRETVEVPLAHPRRPESAEFIRLQGRLRALVREPA
ncbi:MAG: ABC transporter ATP-binding protein [Betaproteobacteria bacterium]|nr:ABC transporter ATP-binding protein [Betaproteobacteria bacterium]